MILVGAQIAISLGRTESTIKLQDANNDFVRILGRDEIDEYLARGYEAHGTKRCVRYLRPPLPVPARRPELPWAACWRTQYAAVIAFHGEQITPGVEYRAA